MFWSGCWFQLLKFFDIEEETIYHEESESKCDGDKRMSTLEFVPHLQQKKILSLNFIILQQKITWKMQIVQNHVKEAYLTSIRGGLFF